MKFYDLLSQVMALLQREERVSYRALKREFDVADDVLEDLKEELITVKELAVDQDGKMLVWVGSDRRVSSVQSLESQTLPSPDPRHEPPDPRPSSYTPSHLAERIRAATITD